MMVSISIFQWFNFNDPQGITTQLIIEWFLFHSSQRNGVGDNDATQDVTSIPCKLCLKEISSSCLLTLHNFMSNQND